MPIIISTLPSFSFTNDSFCCFLVLNLDISSIFIGHFANLSRKVLKCCSAKSVVGTKTTTCFEFIADIKAALSATSVLPNPTSPQTNLSIGLGASISFITLSIASSWSGVSSKGNSSMKDS